MLFELQLVSSRCSHNAPVAAPSHWRGAASILRRMASPLPAGLNPIQAGRLGLWLLSRRSHNAAKKRIAFPQREWNLSLMRRYAQLMVRWHVYEYPGASRFIAAVLGISDSYAVNLLRPSRRLPPHIAGKLADNLVSHASQCEALAAELRAYQTAEDNRKFSNKGIERRRERVYKDGARGD